MRKILFFVLLSCFAFGQDKRIDSLRNKLKNSKNKHFELLNLLAWEYTAINPDSVVHYNELSKKHIKNEKERGQYFVLNATTKFLTGSLAEAEAEANRSLQISTKEKDYGSIGASYNILAKIKSMEGDFKKAEDFSEKSFVNTSKTKNKERILRSLINYGSSLLQNGKTKEGIDIYKSAEKYFYKGSEFEQGHIYFNLGRIFLDKNDFQSAISYLEKAETKHKQINFTQNLFDIYFTYAEIYTDLKNQQKAQLYLKKAKVVTRNDLDESDLHFITAQLNYNFGKLDIAKMHLEKAIFINQNEQDYSRLGEDYLLMAQTLNAGKDFSNADDYLKKAIALFKENNESENLRQSYEKIIPNYFQKNNQNEYATYFSEYQKLNSEHQKKEKTQALYDLDKKYQTAEKEAQIKSQQLEIEKEKTNRNFAICGGAFLLLLSGGGFLFLRNRQKQKELQNQNTLLSLQQNLNAMELQSLNKQLDPHEIKNLLASISPEIQEKAPESYEKMLKLFNITKASLNNNSLTESIEIQIQQIEDFLSLEKMMLSENFEYSVENKIENKELQIPRLMLKNLVENAIKHGIKGNGGIINVLISEKNGFITIIVDDSGKGRKHAISLDSGIGTSTYQNLFATLNQKNKENATFEIIDKEQGTKVEVKIPVDYKYN